MRHLKRRPSSGKEVIEVLKEPLRSKQRKKAVLALTKETDFEQYLDVYIRSKGR